MLIFQSMFSVRIVCCVRAAAEQGQPLRGIICGALGYDFASEEFSTDSSPVFCPDGIDNVGPPIEFNFTTPSSRVVTVRCPQGLTHVMCSTERARMLLRRCTEEPVLRVISCRGTGTVGFSGEHS